MIFVIQDHRAKVAGRHWDLRLEWSGSLESYQTKRSGESPEPKGDLNERKVMRSWAIPKHKLPDVGEKLLAMPTEDHPMSYNHFAEPGQVSIIPAGYGAGEVRLVARGEYILNRLSPRGSITFRFGQIEYAAEEIYPGPYHLFHFQNKFLITRA